MVKMAKQLEKISISSVSTTPPANFGPTQQFSHFYEPSQNRNRENNYPRTNNTKFNTPRKNCNYCGKTGHESSTCWLKNRCCENCNKPGHSLEECKWRQQTMNNEIPRIPIKIDNIELYALLDSGASNSLINETIYHQFTSNHN